MCAFIKIISQHFSNERAPSPRRAGAHAAEVEQADAGAHTAASDALCGVLA
jgi:hypothetical protein